MTAIAGKIRDIFSDFFLEVELFFSKFSKKAAPSKGKEKEQVKEEVIAKAEVKTESKTEAKPEAKEKLPFAMRILRMGAKDRLFFYDQMATLIGSGVTLIDSLSLVQAQTKNKGLKKLYAELIHQINTGSSLADAMYKFPHIFPRMQAALMEAAEKSGNLKLVLAELVEEMEAGQEFKRKITGAMFYPVLLLFLAFGMVAGMMIFVIPKVAGMYKQANVDLPPLTQTVIDVSDFVAAEWILVFGGTFLGILILWILFAKVKMGRYIWEKFISIIPIVGRLNKEKNLMMISSNMAMLMKSGVLISDAFLITEKTLGNLHYQKGLNKIQHGIVMGKEVSEMMGLEDIKTQKFKKNKLFPLQMAQMMHIGETTGRIAEMFVKLKENYHKSIDYTLKNISTIVEPVMIFFVAAIVGTILLAVMLPFFYIGTTIS